VARVGPGTRVGAALGRGGCAAPATRLGEHTKEILGDVAKLPPGEIGRLFDDGVVAGPPKD